MSLLKGIVVAASCTLLAACHSGGGGGQMAAIGKTDAARLARSIGIIRRSTKAHPGVLRILFYGQSITSTKWTDPAVAQLRRAYPDTRFVVRNMAIGGNDAVLLERAAERDLTDFYPDLVVFHVYGDHHAYERIIRMIRAQTAAEVIVQTDHVRFPVEPICDEGLHFDLHTPPGCTGTIWRRQRVWDDFMSGTFIPRMAARYALAVDPRRAGWNLYLARHDLAPGDLLQDGLHPNDTGWRLAAVLFDRYFEQVVGSWRGEEQNLIRSFPLEAGGVGRRVDGNRIELIASGPLDGQVTATIDAVAPKDLDGCWQNSRTTPVPTVADWPALRQVEIDPAYHRADAWTATLTGFDDKQDDFAFTLVGQRDGPDGTGRGNQNFRSTSGHVSIEARDWAFAYAATAKQVRVPDRVTVRWTRQFVCNDQPVYPLGDGRSEYRYVVATGLKNTAHVMTLTMDAAAAALVREVRVYRPPLAE